MKKMLALVLALAMCFALAACGAKEEAPAEKPAETPAETPAEKPAETPAEDPLRILYACTDMGAAYFPESYAGFVPVWDELGIEHALEAPPGGYSAEGQISHLENSITSGNWDVILAYVEKPATCGHIVDFADQYGVKVIGYCQTAETNMGHVYFGVDPVQQGEMCAQMAIDYLNEHPELYAEYDENNKIPYAIMASFDNPQAVERDAATKRVLDADGRFEMVYEQNTPGVEQAMAYAENLLTLHPDIKFILGNSDTVALAVMEVLNSAGYADDESVAIFSHNAEPAAHDSIRNGGLLRGSGYAPYSKIAEDVVTIAKDIVNDKLPDPDNYPYIHCYGVTAANIDEFFPQ